MIEVTGNYQITRIANESHNPKIVIKASQVHREAVYGNNAMPVQIIVEQTLNTLVMFVAFFERAITIVERIHNSQVIHAKTFMQRRMNADHC